MVQALIGVRLWRPVMVTEITIGGEDEHDSYLPVSIMALESLAAHTYVRTCTLLKMESLDERANSSFCFGWLV